MSQIKRALALQLAGLFLAVGLVMWLSRHYPVADWLAQWQSTIGSMKAGAVLYPFLYGACNVFLLPAGVLAMGSGLFFGLWWGFAINLTGNVAGAAVAFFLSRRLGRRWVTEKFLRHRKWAALDEAIAREGWKIILLSQLPPLSPVSLLNYLYGITRVRFGTCMLWVAVGQAPTMFLYAYLGTLAQHGLRLWQGKSNPQPIEYVIWIGGFLLTLSAITALARIALRALAEAERAVISPNSAMKTTLPHPEPVTVEADTH